MTTTGWIDITLRPLKLAFLVQPSDKESLLRAIQINTFLWGGLYNPIIPFFRKRPRNWDTERFAKHTSNEIIQGYVEAFDPDFIVRMGNCPEIDLPHSGIISILPNEILRDVQQNGLPSFGIGLFEILQKFISEELKFIRAKPLRILMPNFHSPHHLFLSSAFGDLPSCAQSIFNEEFRDRLNPEVPKCGMKNFHEFVDPRSLSLLDISSQYITPRSRARGNIGNCVFLMDATNTMDVIDYWNLRALGNEVIPFPTQAYENVDFRKLIVDFVNQHHYPLESSAGWHNYTDFIGSRYLKPDFLKSFVQSLEIEQPKDGGRWKYVIHRSYPRIWSPTVRDADGASCCILKAKEERIDLHSEQKELHLQTLDPDFPNSYGAHGKPRFVNVLEFHLFGGDEFCAEVIPKGDASLIRAIGVIFGDEWRCSNIGIVYLSLYSKSSFDIPIPKAADVFTWFLESKGWAIEPSIPGKVATQIAKRLGGSYGLSTLAAKGIVQMLERTGKPNGVVAKSLLGEIQKLYRTHKPLAEPAVFLRKLVETGIIEVGLRMQCPSCGRFCWVAISDISKWLKCSNCSERFSFPTNPEEAKWAYRTSGPFSHPDQSQGAYPVLLAIRFFSVLSRQMTTPMMSFLARKGNEELEVDLGLLMRSRRYGVSGFHLVFGECKTNSSFVKKDIGRMRLLGNMFPRSVLCFVTMKKYLTKTEQDLIRPLVNRSRKAYLSERSYNPVLILTETELCADSASPECWKNLDGRYSKFAAHHPFTSSIEDLCDVTSQIYLHVESLSEWLKQRRT